MSGLGTSTQNQQTQQQGTSATNQTQQQTQNQTQNQTQQQTGSTAQNTTGLINTGQTQASSTNPWAAALPTVNSLLSTLNPLIGNSGLTSAQQTALGQLASNANAGNPYAGQISANATSLLNGGGAQNQAGAVNQNYQNYQAQTNPLASNTNYDPTQTPGVQAALQAIQAQVGNNVNSQFAGAGRSLSGANQMAYGTGIAQAEAPLLLGQYNQNVQNQQNAASSLYGAGNSTANTLAGYQTQANANTQAGTQAASDALTAQNYSPTQALAVATQAQQLPQQNLQTLSNIGTQLAGLGQTTTGNTAGTQSSTGTANTLGTSDLTSNATSNAIMNAIMNASGTTSQSGTTNQTNQASPLSMLSSLGGLFSGGANSAINGLGSAASGLGSAASSGIGGLLSLVGL